jgi:hypothetical protein
MTGPSAACIYGDADSCPRGRTNPTYTRVTGWSTELASHEVPSVELDMAFNAAVASLAHSITEGVDWKIHSRSSASSSRPVSVRRSVVDGFRPSCGPDGVSLGLAIQYPRPLVGA